MDVFISIVEFILRLLEKKFTVVVRVLIIGLVMYFVLRNLDYKCIDDFYKAENGHYYQIFSEETDWDSARKKCRDECGHLVTILDENEQSIVEGVIQNNNCWMGAVRDSASGSWKWITGEEFGYTNWDEGEPNNQYGTESVGMIYFYGKWNDGNMVGSYKMPYVCEWEHKINFLLFNEFSFGFF